MALTYLWWNKQAVVKKEYHIVYYTYISRQSLAHIEDVSCVVPVTPYIVPPWPALWPCKPPDSPGW